MVWVYGFDLCGSGFWVMVMQWWCGAVVCGWVLILRGAVVMETMPVEAWRSASDGF